MSAMPVLSAAFAALLFCNWAFASDVSSGPSFLQGNLVPVSANASAGSFGRVESLDLNGDLTPDIVQMRGNRLLVFLDPAVHTSCLELSSTALDLCTLSTSESGAGPAILFTSALGLHRASWNAATHSFDQLLIDTSKSWQGAERVTGMAQIGGAARALVGLAADRRTVFTAEQTGPTSYAAPKSVFALVASVNRLELMEWEAMSTSTSEVALLTTQGIQVRNLKSGATVLARNALQSGDAIAVVRKPGLGDGLVWITRGTDMQQRLYLFHQGASFGLYQPPTLLSGLIVSSVTAGDFDGDGDDDLALLAQDAAQVFLSRNDSAPNTWYASSGTLPQPAFAQVPAEMLTQSLWDEGYEGSTNSGGLIWAPLYGEWLDADSPRLDFAFGLELHQALRVQPALPAASQFGLAGEGDPVFEALFYVDADAADPNGGCADNEYGSAGLWVRLADGWQSHAGANAVEMVVWKCNASGIQLDPSAVLHCVKYLPASGDESGVTLPFYAGSSLPGLFDERFFFELRLVAYNAPTNSVVQAWRTSILSTSATYAGQSWLAAQPGASSTLVSVNPAGEAPSGITIENCALLSQGSAISQGQASPCSGYPQARIPPPPPVQPPVPGPIQTVYFDFEN